MDLLTIVKAQGADDYVSPTIPFIPPTGTVTPSVTQVVVGPSISLESNYLTLKKGEKAKIKVVIFTNSKEVRAFSFKIEYDASLFKVVDANSSVAGTQIPYSNTFFKEKSNSVTISNNVGKIEFQAESSTGLSPITNKVVSEFEVEALALGTGKFEVTKSGSSLVNSESTNILVNTNILSLTVGNQTVTIVPTITVTATPSNNVTTTPKISKTPNTALSDDIGNIGTVLLGALLIVSGFYLFKKKRNYDLQR